MTTKHSLYIVTIHGTEHAVRATGKRAAQAFAIDKRIDTRLAETDDIIRICRSGVEILGEKVEVDPNQTVMDVTPAADPRTDTQRKADETFTAIVTSDRALPNATPAAEADTNEA